MDLDILVPILFLGLALFIFFFHGKSKQTSTSSSSFGRTPTTTATSGLSSRERLAAAIQQKFQHLTSTTNPSSSSSSSSSSTSSSSSPFNKNNNKNNNNNNNKRGGVGPEHETGGEEEEEEEYMKDYTIPQGMKSRHSTYFMEKSGVDGAEALEGLQLVLLLDQSGSMEWSDQDPITNRPCRRWDNLIRCTLYLFDTMLKYDKDCSIPCFFFSNQVKEVIVRSRKQLFEVMKKITPSGGTDLLAALKQAISKYANREENVLFVVFTDGQPNPGQPRPIKNYISTTLPRLDPTGNCLNILFIRMGDDSGAIRFLQDLDDCAEIGDWVDTKADNDVYSYGPENVLVNAIFEHLEAEFDQI